MILVICDPLKFMALHLFAWQYTVMLKLQGVRYVYIYFFFSLKCCGDKNWEKICYIKIKQKVVMWRIKQDVYFKLSSSENWELAIAVTVLCIVGIVFSR